MSPDDALMRILTEIRDNQREDLSMRLKATEESLRQQRTAVRWQRTALVLLVVFILLLGVAWYSLGGLE